jgi:hypothetical protein
VGIIPTFSFNGDYVWSISTAQRGVGRCEIRAPPFSMPLSVRFKTDSAMTRFTSIKQRNLSVDTTQASVQGYSDFHN